jgi:hypothetical protein
MKTKTELIKMSKEEIEAEEQKAWVYFSKVKAIMNFNELEE